MATKKQLLFVQGGGSGTHDTWDNKLVASLGQALGRDYAIRYPRMPMKANPTPRRGKRRLPGKSAS